MRSAQLVLEKYDSDKIANYYLERYDPILEYWVDQKITLLELGVRNGGSLLLWRDYFPLGNVVGIDIRLPKDFIPPARVQIYEGSQADPAFLSRVASETAPDGFDIIIDDASHVGELTKISFWHLFDNHLKPGGLYVIEDWGTGYWDDWPDGKALVLTSRFQPDFGHSPLWFKMARFWFKVARKLNLKTPMRCHSYGMVGFVKQLLDEQAAHDVTSKQLKGKPTRGSKFESILVVPSIVFVKKSDHQRAID